ncbi:hypothetical protein Tco_1217722 [Tanacetum coccineum]
MKACGASHINNAIPQKEKDPGSFTLPCFINDFCFDNALVNLGASVSVMPLSTYLNLGLGELAHTRLTVELADRMVKYPKGIAENVLVRIGKFTFPVNFIILDMLEDIKVPLILERPFLSTAHAKIDVYKRKITLRVEEEKIVFTSVISTSSLIKRVYMLSLRERMELDLEVRLMGETLVINRSLDPFLEDYIELNDLNEPFELRRNQGDDLMPTIEEGEVIEEFRIRNEDLDTGIDDYPSYCDDDKKIHIDCAHNLKFSCMIGFEFTHANFFPLLSLINVPDHLSNFSVIQFCRSENMDAIVMKPIHRIHQGRYGVSVPALTKDHKRNEDQYAISRGLNTPYSRYGINIIFWKISNVVPTPRNPQYAVSNTWIRRIQYMDTPMPPKRTSTSEAVAMTQAAIRKLVADSVTAALEAQAATMANADNTNRNTGEREACWDLRFDDYKTKYARLKKDETTRT